MLVTGIGFAIFTAENDTVTEWLVHGTLPSPRSGPVPDFADPDSSPAKRTRVSGHISYTDQQAVPGLECVEARQCAERLQSLDFAGL